MLSAEGRSAYAQWRGEEDSCRLEDLNSACEAAISSLSTISCGSWLELDSSSRNQSLFYGEPTSECGLILQSLDSESDGTLKAFTSVAASMP